MSDSPKAVILLSGGIDSSTTLAIARDRGFDCYALSFRYGQNNYIEVESAKKMASSFGVARHIVLDIDLSVFGGSALTGTGEIPKDRNEDEIYGGGIPVSYVPARNTVFLSLGLAWAETIGSHDIFIGVNSIDYSGYPDCREKFIRSFENTANLGTKQGTEGHPYKIHTPLINLTKAEIIDRGIKLGVDYSITISCYDPDDKGKSCGRCDSCLLRKKGFKDAGIEDPTEYVYI